MPTNISPDMRGELGNGTVDVTKNMTVTWQVNGPSAMVAFSITIYLNDTASTKRYTTGKLKSGCPFYGTNYSGNAVPFSYTIPASTLSGAGITNGNDYKMVIQQYWSSSDSVTQASASVFQARKDPTLTLTVPAQMDTRSYTFTATYAQAQGDTLNWVRWQLASGGNVSDPIYDTGNIYGTAELKFTYDGFFRDTKYSVRCMIQTEKGIEVDSGWKSFTVNYSTYPLDGAVMARCASGDVSAVSVEWPQVKYIPGTPTGLYEITDGHLEIKSGGSVTWSSVNGSAMSLASPWTLMYKGKLVGGSVTLFTLTLAGGITVTVKYKSNTRSMDLQWEKRTSYVDSDGSTKTKVSYASGIIYGTVSQEATLTIFMTPTEMVIHCTEMTGGLYPADTRYPSETLYPSDDSILTSKILNGTYPRGGMDLPAVKSVTLGNPQICDFIKIKAGSPTESELEELKSGAYEPTYTDDTYMLADFTSSLNAGNLGQTEDNLIGLSVYRRTGTESKLVHLADLSMNADRFLDYGAGSQQGPYTYYVFPTGQNTYLSDPLASNAITPIFWNWTVLVCDNDDDGSYRVTEEYTFGKNLTSGSITNNNTPNIAQNFTRYPTIQMATANYKSGTLSSLIGVIDHVNGNGYSDTLALRDAIFDLSTTTKSLFLKSRKGDVMPIRIGGPIQMETMDGTRSQAQTVTLPWVEIGSHDDLSIISL